MNDSVNHKELKFHQRLKMAIEFRQRSMGWLANQIGLTRAGVLYLTTKATKPNYIPQIAHALEINPVWLSTGSENILLDERIVNHIYEVPVFSFDKIIDVFQKKEYYSNHKIFTEKLMDTSFATIYPFQNIELHIKKGSLVIVDCSQKIGIGIFMVMLKKNRAVYIKEKNRYNELYFTDSKQESILESECIIMGKVVEERYYFK
jgi:hypothetical protein